MRFEKAYDTKVVYYCPEIKGFITHSFFHETIKDTNAAIAETCRRLKIEMYEVVEQKETNVRVAHVDINKLKEMMKNDN